MKSKSIFILPYIGKYENYINLFSFEIKRYIGVGEVENHVYVNLKTSNSKFHIHSLILREFISFREDEICVRFHK